MLGLESEVFTALYFEKVEGHHYLFEGFVYFLNIVITKKKIHLLGFMFRWVLDQKAKVISWNLGRFVSFISMSVFISSSETEHIRK